MSKHYAVISIGTNSTRALLADVAPAIPRTVVARTIGTRIGEGLGASGQLGDEPMARTLDALRQLQRSVRGHYLRLFAVATSALRRAENGDEFLARAGDILGVPVRVLSGDEEAEASYRGAITALGELRGERVGAIDTGGGSTEYAVGTTTAPERVISSEIGSVRLTEANPTLAGRSGTVDSATIERARAAARAALAPLSGGDPVERLALVGGSATTTAAILRAHRGAVDAYPMTRADLQRVLERLCSVDLDGRKAIEGMRAQRADILPGGIIVLDAALEILGIEEAVATTSDLLLGILLAQRDAAEPPAGQGRPIRAGSASKSQRGNR